MKSYSGHQIDKIIALLVLVATLLLAIATIVFFAADWRGMLVLTLAVMAVGGLAAYFKLKPVWARVAGFALFGLSLLWLFLLPALLLAGQRVRP